MLLLGFIGLFSGFLSGVLGIGGGIITLSAVYFLAPLAGLTPFTLAACTGFAAAQSLASCTSSSWVHYQQGRLHLNTVVWIGCVAMAGSLAGGFLTPILPEITIQWIYCATILILMTLYLSRKEPQSLDVNNIPTISLDSLRQTPTKSFLTLSLTFISGVIAGLLGIGGSIFLIPIMVVFLGLPTIIAIGCGAGTAWLISIASLISKASVGAIIWKPAIVIAIAAFIGGRFGAQCTRYIPPQLLRNGLLIIMAIALSRMLMDLL